MTVTTILTTVSIVAAAFASATPSSPGGATAGPDKAAATACNIDGKQTELGASYVTSLEADGTDCREAEAVVRAYHQCRKDDGGADGKCSEAVKGYRCSEGKREGVPGVQYSATVRCNRGGASVTHTYTQNT